MHALALVGHGGAPRRLAQPLRVLVAEFEPLLQRRHFFLRRLVHCEPQKLPVIEPLKRGPPILDLLGLLLVEYETCEHLPSFQRRLRFPLSVGELTSQQTVTG